MSPKRNVLAKSLIVIASMLLTHPGFAQDPDELPDENWDGAPILTFNARTLFPLYIGGGPQLHASPQLRIGLDFGTTPGAYSEAIGSAASNVMQRDEYKSTIKAAFHDSSLYRVYLRYALNDEVQGFGMEFGLAQISAKGEEKMADVAKAANLESDFRSVEALIQAAGYRPYVTLKTKLLTFDMMGTYTWDLQRNLTFTAGAGLTKVLGAEVDLSTEVDQFDSSKLGMALLNLGETELADGIEKYGLSPVLLLEAAYSF